MYSVVVQYKMEEPRSTLYSIVRGGPGVRGCLRSRVPRVPEAVAFKRQPILVYNTETCAATYYDY